MATGVSGVPGATVTATQMSRRESGRMMIRLRKMEAKSAKAKRQKVRNVNQKDAQVNLFAICSLQNWPQISCFCV